VLIEPDPSSALTPVPAVDDLTIEHATAPLDADGEPDIDASIGSFGGWTALLLPGLAELAGDDPELLALVEALGSGDELEAGLRAGLTARVEAATEPKPADERGKRDKGGKGRKGSKSRKRDEGAGTSAFLAASLGSGPARGVAPAAEAGAGSPSDAGLGSTALVELAVLGKLIQEQMGPRGGAPPPPPPSSEAPDGTKVTQELEFGAAGEDMGIGISAEKDGQKASGGLSFSLSGDQCPDADGRVTMEFSAQREVGAGGVSMMERIEGTATGLVNDAAQLTEVQLDVSGSMRRTDPGRSAYSEGRATGTLTYANDYTMFFRNAAPTWEHRSSSQATFADRQRAVDTTVEAVRFAGRAMLMWQTFWRDGYCVKVKANIPAKVSPSEQRSLDVHVVHKDGSELDAPVDATLSGTRSLDPLRIDKAPGQLTYSAGAKKGDSATIDLVSTSRRGIGKLKGTVKVEQPGYRMKGGADALKVDAVVCDLSKPFTVTGSGIRLRFTPDAADPLSGGTYEYSGDFKKFKVSGNGTYKLKVDAGGGTLDAKGPGKAIGPLGTFTNRGKEHYELTPADCS